MPRRILWLAAACVLLAVMFAADFPSGITQWFRGGYGWRWMYSPMPFERVLPLIIILIIYVLGAWVVVTRGKIALIWAIFGTVIISLGVAYAREGDALRALFTRTAAGSTTGQHWAAALIDWESDDWHDWTAVMGEYGGHVGTSPPGLIMLYGAVNHTLTLSPSLAESLRAPVFDYQCHNYEMLTYTPAEWASTWFGILMPLWAGLTVLPLYAIAKRLTDANPAYVVLWWAIVPGISGFAGSWSTAYPLISAFAFWLLLIALERFRYGTLAGIAAGLALFANFAFLPILGLFGFYTLGAWRFLHKFTFRQAVILGIWYGIGILIPWVLFWLYSGETPWAILQASFDYHLDLDRPYWFWVWMHVWDFALWSGLGLAVLWLLDLRRRRETTPGMVLAGSVALTILIMTISATTRGESGRIWLFLTPFVLIAALDSFHRITKGNQRAWGILTAANAALTLALTANLLVMSTDLTNPPPPPMVAGGFNFPVNSQFAVDSQPAFELVSWYAAQQGDSIRLALQWRGIRPMHTAYWFSALLIAPDGSTTQPTLWQPREVDGQSDRYPTTCWQPDVLFEDVILLPLPEDAPAGDWWISLAAFGDNSQPEGRLQVFHVDTTMDSQVGIGPVQVTEG